MKSKQTLVVINLEYQLKFCFKSNHALYGKKSWAIPLNLSIQVFLVPVPQVSKSTTQQCSLPV